MFAGLQAELYYVRDGVINTYALNFVVPIPANISELEFSWQSLIRQPVSTIHQQHALLFPLERARRSFCQSIARAHAKRPLCSPAAPTLF
jgi:hypothetical protein